MFAYKCKVEYNDGSRIEEKKVIIVSSSIEKISKLCERLLFRHSDDSESIEIVSIERINIPNDNYGIIIEED